eukprot:Phypoly_transcript_22079.p1 GENE.Phypoly_transcript_22079~~Phypoly_transcript_22079.p1  ORF type:complete len:160 (+),score=19.81 Phypoly_transcript_22079:100-579(+)
MSSLPVSVILFLCFTSAFAHMCMFSPPQRGALQNVNTANTLDCSWTKGPCGGEYDPEKPYTAFARGTNFTVVWQKNQNHWYSSNPGSFSLSWADSNSPTDFQEIYSFVDTNLPSLTVYSYVLDVSAKIPASSKSGIFQLVYYCPGINYNFYQCADVVVF